MFLREFHLKLLKLLDGGVGGGPRLLELAPVLRLEPLLLRPVTLLLRLLELKWNEGAISHPTISINHKSRKNSRPSNFENMLEKKNFIFC